MQSALSLLDRARCYRLYGSSVYREGRTVTLQVGDVEEAQAVMQRVEQDTAAQAARSLSPADGLPDAQYPIKVWAAYLAQQEQKASSTSASCCHLLSPSGAAGSVLSLLRSRVRLLPLSFPLRFLHR